MCACIGALVPRSKCVPSDPARPCAGRADLGCRGPASLARAALPADGAMLLPPAPSSVQRPCTMPRRPMSAHAQGLCILGAENEGISCTLCSKSCSRDCTEHLSCHAGRRRNPVAAGETARGRRLRFVVCPPAQHHRWIFPRHLRKVSSTDSDHSQIANGSMRPRASLQTDSFGCSVSSQLRWCVASSSAAGLPFWRLSDDRMCHQLISQR